MENTIRNKKSNLSSILSHLSSSNGFTFLKKKQTGFTLVELMVVFSLMAVVTGIGFVSFSSYNRKQEFNQAAQEIKQTFDTAKFNALSSVKSATACPTGETLIGYKVVLCAKATCIGSNRTNDYYELDIMCENSEAVLSSKKILNNVSINTLASTCGGEVKYDTLTNKITGASCKIVVEGNGVAQAINLDASGNASIQQ